MARKSFTTYTTETTVTADFPFHISRSEVESSEQDEISRVSQIHSHEYLQILYVNKGEITNEIDGNVETITAGELIILPPFIKHRNQYFIGSDVFTISFTASFIDSSFTSPFQLFDKQNFAINYLNPFLDLQKRPKDIKTLRFEIDQTHHVKEIVKELYFSYLKLNSGQKLKIHSQLLNLLTMINISFDSPQSKSQAVNHQQAQGQVQSVIDYISQNSSRDLHIDELIEKTSISPAYFRRIFKEITGKSIVKYLTELRIYNAIQLIKSQKYNLTEISDRTGFTDKQNFYRSFKKIMGCSPSDFIKNELK